MPDTATFRATLPPIMSAIRMSGDGGMRVMFDVPESDMPEALKLLMWKQRVLQVTVGPEVQESERDEWSIGAIA
jgi:hypothetical protein